MKIATEKNIDVLRQAALLLEATTIRYTKEILDLRVEILTLQNRGIETIQTDLPEIPTLEEILKSLADKATTKAADDKDTKKTKTKKSERDKRKGLEDPSDKNGKPQTGHGPTPQPNLPIIKETYGLDEVDLQTCIDGCNVGLERWEEGDDVRELVAITPASFHIKKQTILKYRCPKCGTLERGVAPPLLRPGGRYDPSVVVHSVIDKFGHHIPTERQCTRALEVGAVISSQALWDQQRALATLLTPLTEKIRQAIVKSDFIGADLSPVPYIQEGGTEYSQAWQIACPKGCYIEIFPSKKAIHGVDLLRYDRSEPLTQDSMDALPLHKDFETFSGHFQTDGASELACVARVLTLIVVACMSHARRNVLGAKEEAPEQVEVFVKKVGKLYAIEKEALLLDDEGEPLPSVGRFRRPVDLEKLRVLRDTKSRAVLEDIWSWMRGQTALVPNGKLLTALKYVSNRQTALSKFLEDPHIPLDTNFVERGFLEKAIGVRNWLGCRSENGMQVLGVFLTIIGSAKMCGHVPGEYLAYATEAALNKRPVLPPHEWSGP